MASCAARLISAGAEKSGNPCARLTALYCIACRVISRITDSVKCSTLSERKCLGGAETCAMGGKASTRNAQVGTRHGVDFAQDRFSGDQWSVVVILTSTLP